MANPGIGFPPIRTPLLPVIEGLGYAGDFKSLFKDYDKQQKGTEFGGESRASVSKALTPQLVSAGPKSVFVAILTQVLFVSCSLC